MRIIVDRVVVSLTDSVTNKYNPQKMIKYEKVDLEKNAHDNLKAKHQRERKIAILKSVN